MACLNRFRHVVNKETMVNPLEKGFFVGKLFWTHDKKRKEPKHNKVALLLATTGDHQYFS